MNKKIIVLALGILPLLLAGIASAQDSSLYTVVPYVTGDQVTFTMTANNLSVENVQATAEIVSNGLQLSNVTFTGHGQISAVVTSSFTLYIFVGGKIVYDHIYPAPSGAGVSALSPLGIAALAAIITGSSVISSYVAVRFSKRNEKEQAVVPDGQSGIDTGAIDSTFHIVKDVVDQTAIPETLVARAENDPDGTQVIKNYARKIAVNTLQYYRHNTRSYFGYTDKEWDEIVKGKLGEKIGVNMDNMGRETDVQ